MKIVGFPPLAKKPFIWIFAVLAVCSILFYFFVLKDLPLPTKLSSPNAPQSTQIFDRNQKLLYTIYSKKNQTFIPLSSTPKYMQQATIAIEDKDFYRHGAIDLRGIFRSLVAIAFHHQIQGGSTLTQQLVKNSLLTPERTILRKIKEVVLSFATEAIYSKDKILEMYLNQSPYGGTAWGVEAGALMYFGKHATKLNLAESALLAGLPEAPTTNSPFGARPEYAKKRQEKILNKMYEAGYISAIQKENAKKEHLNFKKVSDRILAPHFVLYVKDLLVKKYGEEMVLQGGLKVITSLDLTLQNFAQEVVSSEVDKLGSYHVTNSAAIITNPATGEILAMVGSKNYFDTTLEGNVNVVLSLRQPGSSIKPINYAVGLMNKYTAATAFVDQKTCFPNPRGKDYCPVNYDGKWHGVVQLRYALGNSINIPAVKMLKLNGVEAMIATASAMGITTFTDPARYGLSLTLGGGDVTMLEMAQAYGVLANQGYKITLRPILKITKSDGKILEKYNPPKSPVFGKKILPSDVTFIISDILADNNARAIEFGENSALTIKGKIVSVKTGTTNDFRDNWTIGYTPRFVVATWVGNNDNSPMSNLASGITGAAPIWNKIMSHLLKDKLQETLKHPVSLIQKKICSTSGLLPQPDSTPNACPTRFEYFIKGTEPSKTDLGMQKVWIDKTTNNPAAPKQTDNVEERDALVVTDPTGDSYCLSCPQLSPSPSPP